MSRHQEGGKKAYETTVERHGREFVEERGRKGGRKSRGGGFTGNPTLAAEAAKKRWERLKSVKITNEG